MTLTLGVPRSCPFLLTRAGFLVRVFLPKIGTPVRAGHPNTSHRNVMLTYSNGMIRLVGSVNRYKRKPGPPVRRFTSFHIKSLCH